MKLALSTLIVLVSLNSVAQQWGRGQGWGHPRPGYGQPGPGPGYGRPPMPPPQYANPDYGPAYTVRWQDYGTTQLPKLIDQEIHLDVRGQLVNEILLRSVGNMVTINSVLVYLQNGQVIDLRQATGSIRNGQEIRARIDYNYSIRVDRIIVKGTSSGLIGSRGQVSVTLGLAN